MHKTGFLASITLSLLLLSACGTQSDVNSASVAEPDIAPPEPAATISGPLNPLTGELIGEEWIDRRPVAIMLNNLKEAQPQLGQSHADIIYEVLAEGGITRMLAVYQDFDDVGRIGSIRSARPYYLELALGHDAIYIHAGGSEPAYAKIKEWGVTNLDGVRGPYMSNKENENLMWRDPQRRKSYSLEHTVVTTGDSLMQRLPTYTKLRLNHQDGWTYDMDFTQGGTPIHGAPASSITVPYSKYKTGVFTYDEDSNQYLVEEYGKPYLDGEENVQVAVTNVVVLKTACRDTGDSLGHITVDLSGGGDGWFACGGKVIPLKWSKSFPDGQLHYTDSNGDPIIFGVGKTYVNIVPLEREVTFT